MTAGPITKEAVAMWLGVPHDSILDLISTQGLPAVKLAGNKRAVYKFYLGPLHEWARRQAVGAEPTMEHTREQLAAAQERVEEMHARRKNKRKEAA